MYLIHVITICPLNRCSGYLLNNASDKIFEFETLASHGGVVKVTDFGL